MVRESSGLNLPAGMGGAFLSTVADLVELVDAGVSVALKEKWVIFCLRPSSRISTSSGLRSVDLAVLVGDDGVDLDQIGRDLHDICVLDFLRG